MHRQTRRERPIRREHLDLDVAVHGGVGEVGRGHEHSCDAAQIERLILWGRAADKKRAGSKSNWSGQEDDCARIKESEPFPGHLEARQGVKAGISWKTNYRERFGLDLLDVGLFEELGRLMAASGKVPLGLRRLVDSAIALGDD